jgi:hypothetical protein
MRFSALRRLAAATLALAGLGVATESHAFLTLTAAGVAKGFNLSTVVLGLNGNTPNCCNVLGSAVNSDGNIIINDGSNHRNYVFHDVDNQTAAQSLGNASDAGFPTALANSNGIVYASGGTLRRLNNDGSTAFTFTNINAQYGMWTNPANGHLITYGSAAGVGTGILDVTVTGNTATARLIKSVFTDGLTVSPDGSIVYTDSGAYKISDGSLVASYSISGADGMGVISSSNDLNGDVVVSTGGSGTLVLLDAHNNYAQIVIATGGGYGDFTSPDFTNGTLLISSGDSLLRLGCGQGCGVGSVNPNPGVPEPQSALLIGVALLGLSRVKRKQA